VQILSDDSRGKSERGGHPCEIILAS
jgi:hypothetical protein